MASLGNLNPVSPLDSSDDSRHSFTQDVTETTPFAFDDTPSDFGDIIDMFWQVEYRLDQTIDDDVYALAIRIVNGATILAAADSGGTFATVANNVTNTTDTTSSVTEFAYVNTGASKTTWDGGSVELRQTYTQNKGKDNRMIEVDFVDLTGNYNVAVAAGLVVPHLQNLGRGFGQHRATRLGGILQ